MSSRQVKKNRAGRLSDMSYELLQMIVNQKSLAPPIGLSTEAQTIMTDPAERMKKMKRMEALKRKLISNKGEVESYPIASLRSETESRRRDLQTVEMYRQNMKPENIRDVLNRHITSRVSIATSLGATTFFEFNLRNPHNFEVTVLIEWDDPELSLVTNVSEWRHFKAINHITTPVEEGMFLDPAGNKQAVDDTAGTPNVSELFLRPKESVHIPFKFLTFRHLAQIDPSVNFASNSMLLSNELIGEDVVDVKNVVGMGSKKLNRASNTRTTKVNFRTKRDTKLLGILELEVDQLPHIIDQTFRLTQPEQTFFKKSFRLPQWPRMTGNQVHVRCSDPAVICTSSRAAPGEPVDVFVKAACGSAPKVNNFYVAIYNDPRLSKPVQVWQICIEVVQRVDIAAVQGQTARFALMVRGGLASRLVKCYSSHPNQMSINPEEPFMLLSGNLQQLNVGVRPMKVGVLSMFVNVVDIEAHQLVTRWLIHVITQEPIISRQFELSLTIGGPDENKRISFANPYGVTKTFCVHTNHKDLVRFKESSLQLGPTEKSNICMKFLPATKPGRVVVLVFINDEDDKNEETFAVKVTSRRSV